MGYLPGQDSFYEENIFVADNARGTYATGNEDVVNIIRDNSLTAVESSQPATIGYDIQGNVSVSTATSAKTTISMTTNTSLGPNTFLTTEVTANGSKRLETYYWNDGSLRT